MFATYGLKQLSKIDETTNEELRSIASSIVDNEEK